MRIPPLCQLSTGNIEVKKPNTACGDNPNRGDFLRLHYARSRSVIHNQYSRLGGRIVFLSFKG
jgi:hypothetical protein